MKSIPGDHPLPRPESFASDLAEGSFLLLEAKVRPAMYRGCGWFTQFALFEKKKVRKVAQLMVDGVRFTNCELLLVDIPPNSLACQTGSIYKYVISQQPAASRICVRDLPSPYHLAPDHPQSPPSAKAKYTPRDKTYSHRLHTVSAYPTSFPFMSHLLAEECVYTNVGNGAPVPPSPLSNSLALGGRRRL